MSRLEQIAKSVSELPADELEAFTLWFEDLQAKRWDGRLEADVKAGKLDSLAEAALADMSSGRARPL